MKIPELLTPVLGALCPALLALPALGQGQVTPYGCGLNPPGSLAVMGGAAEPGGTLVFGLDNPTGAQNAGSVALLFAATAPDPAFPCGSVLPGFGMKPGDGELLLGLGVPNPVLTLGPAVWNGAGQPSVFSVGFPNNPSLAGTRFFFQGAIVDPTTAVGIGLSEGLEVAFDGLPDLSVRSVTAAPIPVAPGETVTVKVVVRNTGTADAGQTVVRIADGSGWMGEDALSSVPAGGVAVASIDVLTSAADLASNPHFITAEVDPDDDVLEINENNNGGTSSKPAFVVEPVLLAPVQEFEHDDVFEVVGGAVVNFQHVFYGVDGAPSDHEDFDDPDKGQPHPDTGFKELPTSGVPPQPRVDPKVAAADAAAAPGELLRYVVKFDHGVPMPRLPDLVAFDDRFAKENVPILMDRMAMMEGVRRARIAAVQDLAGLFPTTGGQVLEYYTLAGAMLVEAPKGLLAVLDAHPKVLHVEVQLEEGSVPPDSVADGRARIDSDPYFNSGATGSGFIALLDSGVRESHTLLTGPDRIWFVEDCVDGDGLCNDDGDAAYDPDDDCWDHGTSSAAILNGNTSLGDDSRGVTASWLDSWKVYGNDCAVLNSTAVHRAYDQAVMWGDKIIVAEMQSGQGDTGTIAADADNAFDAGSVTIAANGNNGPGDGTVNSPANAHKAIGVGNYDVDNLSSIGNQSDGPTSDNRYKPDIQAPTNTDTASTDSDVAINNFGATSGATPYAAGAASVFADWFNQTALTSSTSGKIHAALINAGPLEYGQFNNLEGVGKFALPLNGHTYLGTRNVSDGESDYVSFPVPQGASRIAVAIWWGENPETTHRDIDLYLGRPDDPIIASSISVPSVFEHVVETASVVPGMHDIRIYGYEVSAGQSVTVYYAINVR